MRLFFCLSGELENLAAAAAARKRKEEEDGPDPIGESFPSSSQQAQSGWDDPENFTSSFPPPHPLP